MKRYRRLATVFSAVTVLAMTGCGGGGGGSASIPNPSTPVTLNGIATNGPMRNATVTVYELNPDGSLGSILGSGQTRNDDSGRFAITLSKLPTTPFEVKVTGGSYVSEYDSSTVTRQGSMSADIDTFVANQVITVSPVTDMVQYRAKALVASGKGWPQSHSQAKSEVQLKLGLNVDPETSLPCFDSRTTSDKELLHYAVLIGALESMAQNLARSGESLDRIVTALAKDFSDGRLDGVAPDGTGQSAPVFEQTTLSKIGSDRAMGMSSLLAKEVVNTTTAYVNNVSPGAWEKSSLYDKYAPSSTPGYSCSNGYELVYDKNNSPVCWDGKTTQGGKPYLGTYYYCSSDHTAYSSSPGTCSDNTIPAVYTSTDIAIFTAETVHLLTAEEIAAMSAATMSAPLPAYLYMQGAGMTAQDAYKMINQSLSNFYSH